MLSKRLRVGERVRSASGPRAWRLGRIARRIGTGEGDVESTSYLVCWESGGESWLTRASLQPLRFGEPIATEARAARPRSATRLAHAVRDSVARAYLTLPDR
jgi:hypothetical protein